MTRKPLSPEAKAEFDAVLEQAVQRMERHKRNGDATDNELKALTAILEQLRDQPREA